MRNIREFILFLAIFAIVGISYSVPPAGKSTKLPKGVTNVKAGCANGNSKAFVDLNNVRAVIGTRGGKWTDGGASYEVPKGSGKQSVYAGGIWVAGVDVNGQLRVAARTFTSGNSGNDFWPGPLVARGPNLANVTPEICNRYDRLWKIDRDMVSTFRAWTRADPETRQRDFPGYTVPLVLQEWPGNGPDFNEENPEYDRYLAPYMDVDGNGRYNVDGGDYPYYDFERTTDCKFVPERRADSLNNMSVTLYGDQTIWWVYNDKGNIHTQSQGAAIGMEIRAQAFAFSTNDELNNMTFYNYQLINRSTYTLRNAYFGVWVDADVGDYDDDVVGCDINRGLSFAYNGDNDDGDGSGITYGKNPPAVGFDFFEGPYQDPNNYDDESNWPGLGEVEPDCQNGYRDVLDENGNVIRRDRVSAGNIFNGNINGLNFGDGIPDNERWGMRRFVYHKKESGTPTGDPAIAIDYYNYLRGIWLDGTPMTYGGSGYGGTLKAEFMFPWKTDNCNWGTAGIDPNDNTPGGWKMTEPVDGRLLQSAGPFELLPGATNYITIGVPWARTSTGDREHSVALLKIADDKCQKLFENCFRMIDGPHAPDLTVVELDQRFIVHISNPLSSNNYLEGYEEVDPFISPSYPVEARKYKFQGYQVFQLKNKDVTVNQIYDERFSKLVFQCDIQDGVSKLVNYTWDANAGANHYQIMVNGADQGIKHSFEILYDMFASSGEARLVNYKKYYYIAIAYAYNNYKQYDQNNPDALDGQKTPYLASRKSAAGEIRKYEFIPRPPEVSGGGTILNAEYGDKPAMQYLSGRGNANNILELEDSTINQIMAGEPWVVRVRSYKKNYGPFDVKVIDPLNITPGNYTLYLDPNLVLMSNMGGQLGIDFTYNLQTNTYSNRDASGLILNTQWVLIKDGTDTLKSPVWFKNAYEYIIPEYGIAINVVQSQFPIYNAPALAGLPRINNGVLYSSIEYANPLNRWLMGLPDGEGQTPFNWIRAGTFSAIGYADVEGDPEQFFEKIINGTWTYYRFVSKDRYHPGGFPSIGHPDRKFSIPSVDIVITKDKSKWTRCIVIETCEDAPSYTVNGLNSISEGGARKFMLRQAPSKNKEGVSADSMNMPPSDNPDDPNFVSAYGMSWFPGYAIDIGSGQRLNIAFGEDSYLVGQNGRDMIWNPTHQLFSVDGVPVFGGKHFVYVFNTGQTFSSAINGGNFPAYDYGRVLFNLFDRNNTSGATNVNALMTRIGRTMLNAAWVTIPLVGRADQWKNYAEMPDNEVKIKIRMGYPYFANVGGTVYYDSIQNAINKGYPYITFSLDQLAPTRNNRETAVKMLEKVKVVPNPYYAHNPYELTQISNLVKITNLPRTCTVRIFNMNGTLIREFTKDSDIPWIDWNLTNKDDVPIAGGIYLIHISAPNVGERVIKWFGVMRPADLSNF